ncbi:MAG: cytochrome C oxidase subunit IV family protein [Thermomicrobiales bacterium]
MASSHGTAHTPANSGHAEGGGHAHPTERDYIKIAIILSIVTAAEVVIYYIEALEMILVPALLIMSGFKFVVVVGYFMHLKFDDRRLMWIFVSGLALALSVFLVVFAAMHWHKVTEYSIFQPVMNLLS